NTCIALAPMLWLARPPPALLGMAHRQCQNCRTSRGWAVHSDNDRIVGTACPAYAFTQAGAGACGLRRPCGPLGARKFGQFAWTDRERLSIHQRQFVPEI